MGNIKLTFHDCNNTKEIEFRFRELTSNLLTNFQIKTPNGIFQIESLELYLYTKNSKIHRDDWCDRAEEQLNSETWYIKNAFLKRSRIDITAGNREHNLYAAFLVQMLKGQPKDKGSATALRTLLRGHNGSSDWQKTAEEKRLVGAVHGKSIWNAPFCIVQKTANSKSNISFMPRVFVKPKGRLYENCNLRAIITNQED